MTRIERSFKPLMWLMAMLLPALVAGCGGGGDSAAPAAAPAAPTAAGAVCTGSASDCVDLGTAGTFVILTAAAINDTGPSVITGNIGSSGSGAGIEVSCAEMTGSIFDADGAYAGGTVPGATACRQTDAVGLPLAVTASQTAYTDAGNKTATVFPGIATISGATPFGPGVYSYPAGAAITTDVTLSGSATDVWVFQVTGDLTQSAATTVTLAGGALAQNIFWRVTGTPSIAAGSHFEGVILTPNAINLAAGSSINGRLFSGGGAAANLNTSTVRRPGS